MDFEFCPTASGLNVALRGRLTFAENGQFRRILGQLGDLAGVPRVVFDLGGVDYIDSAGLGMLLVARDAVAGQKGRLTLDSARGQVARMLDLARFRDLFQEA